MTEPTNDPYRQWNGQQWMRWDGTAWQPEQVSAMPPPMPPPLTAPVPAVAPVAAAVPRSAARQAPPQRKSHKVCWSVVGGVGALVLALIVVAAATSGKSSSSVAAPSTPVAPAQQVPPGTTPTKAAPPAAAPPADGTIDGDWKIGKVALRPGTYGAQGTLRVTNVVGDPRTGLFKVSVLQGGDVKLTLSGSASDVKPGQTVTVSLLTTDPLPKGVYTTEVQVDGSF